mgnify:FL=1
MEIVNDIVKCDLNIGGDRTIFILEQLGFKWEKVGREEIIRAYHAIRESKKSGKKQYLKTIYDFELNKENKIITIVIYGATSLVDKWL